METDEIYFCESLLYAQKKFVCVSPERTNLWGFYFPSISYKWIVKNIHKLINENLEIRSSVKIA